MKTLLKYFVIFCLSYSCHAMTPEQQQADNQAKLAQLIELVNKQQAITRKNEQSNKLIKYLTAGAAAAVMVGLGLYVFDRSNNFNGQYASQEARFQELVAQNVNLKEQIQAIQSKMTTDQVDSASRSLLKFLLTVCCTHPLAWLPILL